MSLKFLCTILIFVEFDLIRKPSIQVHQCLKDLSTLHIIHHNKICPVVVTSFYDLESLDTSPFVIIGLKCQFVRVSPILRTVSGVSFLL